MVFSSFEFLFRFLPIFILLYYIAPKKNRNLILFLGSIVFYTVGEAEYVLLLLASVVVNYLLGRVIAHERQAGRRTTSLVSLLVALGYDFGMLFFFKYSGLAPELPLGISFYTFQIAAYVIDVYRGNIPPEKSFLKIGTYLTMFPQLIAGPIINYSDVKDALYERTITMADFEQGLRTLILGLAAKVVIADRIGMLWNSILSIGFASISTQLAWMGAFAYSLELYFDFAGYSMMAIGLGRMLGFTIPINFDHPYCAKSVSEFWRRWHITLGRWFREYVYIPLGGNRKGKLRTLVNLAVVWILTALWHGSGYNFLLWGAALFVFLMLEKLFLLRFLNKSVVLCHVYLIVVAVVTWMMFAITDVTQLGIYLCRMFPFMGHTSKTINHLDYIKYLYDYAPLFGTAIVFATPFPSWVYKKIKDSWIGAVAVIICLCISMYYLAISTNNPFMYFNF